LVGERKEMKGEEIERMKTGQVSVVLLRPSTSEFEKQEGQR
jgi:hypothetical protein